MITWTPRHMAPSFHILFDGLCSNMDGCKSISFIAITISALSPLYILNTGCIYSSFVSIYTFYNNIGTINPAKSNAVDFIFSLDHRALLSRVKCQFGSFWFGYPIFILQLTFLQCYFCFTTVMETIPNIFERFSYVFEIPERFSIISQQSPWFSSVDWVVVVSPDILRAGIAWNINHLPVGTCFQSLSVLGYFLFH